MYIKNNQSYRYPVLFLLLAYILVFNQVNADPIIPHNPFQEGTGIYVSDQGVYRFDDQLKLVWSALTQMQTFEPVVFGNKLFIGTSQGLFALDISSGKVIWHIEKDKTIFSPHVYNQRLYAGSRHGQLYSISSSNGDINWSRQFDGWVYSPVVKAEYQQLWTGGQGHRAVAVSIEDGDLLHNVTLDQEVIFSPLSSSPDTVTFNLFNGSTVVINAGKGTVQDIISGKAQARHLMRDDKTVLRSSRDGWLSGFTVDNLVQQSVAKTTWHRKLFESGLSLHGISSHQLLTSDEENQLMIFDVKTKKQVWKKQLKGNWLAPMILSPEKIVVFFRDVMNLSRLKALILVTNKIIEANYD